VNDEALAHLGDVTPKENILKKEITIIIKGFIFLKINQSIFVLRKANVYSAVEIIFMYIWYMRVALGQFCTYST
jgi:hypothetical protein